jgi:hypothetical protein
MEWRFFRRRPLHTVLINHLGRCIGFFDALDLKVHSKISVSPSQSLSCTTTATPRSLAASQLRTFRRDKLLNALLDTTDYRMHWSADTLKCSYKQCGLAVSRRKGAEIRYD